MGNNGLRTPLGFGDNRNVEGAKSAISLSNMSKADKTICPNHPMTRRESESTNHAEGDFVPHHYRGGEKKVKLKEDTQCEIIACRACVRKRNGGGGRNAYFTDVMSKTHMRRFHLRNRLFVYEV